METKVSGYDNLEHVQEPTGHGSEKRLKAKDKKHQWNGNQLFPHGKNDGKRSEFIWKNRLTDSLGNDNINLAVTQRRDMAV